MRMQDIKGILTQADLGQAEVETRTVYTTREVLELGIPHKNAPPEPKICEFCGVTLYHEGIVLSGFVCLWNNNPRRCKCKNAVDYWTRYDTEEKQKRHDEKLAEKRRAMNERIQRLVGKSGIKKRFITRTFDNFKVNPTNQAAFKIAKDYVVNFAEYGASGKGIYFEGTFGTGKTHLAVAIAIELLKQEIPVICKTSIDIFADIKRSYDSGTNYGEYQILDIYKKADLLIIDDLGKEQVTDWSMPLLYSILNDRYEEMRPTIITTNYNEEMLIKRLTPRNGDSRNAEAIISRFQECNNVVTMAWADYRGGSEI